MRASSVLAAALLMLAGAPLAAQQPYHHVDPGFTLSVPAGWRAMPDTTVARMSRVATHAAGTPVRYVAGFQAGDGKRWTDFPYALVQSGDTPPVTEEAFVRAMTGDASQGGLRRAADQIQGSMSLQQVDFTRPSWDAGRHLVWLPSRIEARDGRTVYGLSAFRQSRRGFVAIHYYETRPDRLQPVLLPVAASLRFDAGEGYDPNRGGLPRWSRGVLLAMLLGGLIGVGGALLARRRSAA